jgi:hypothetical protein
MRKPPRVCFLIKLIGRESIPESRRQVFDEEGYNGGRRRRRSEDWRRLRIQETAMNGVSDGSWQMSEEKARSDDHMAIQGVYSSLGIRAIVAVDRFPRTW